MVEYRHLCHVPVMALHEVVAQILDLVPKVAGSFTIVHLFHLHEVHAVVVLLEIAVYLEIFSRLQYYFTFVLKGNFKFLH